MIRDPEDETCLSLLFANQTEEDILLRKELEAVQTEHPDRFKLWYTVDRPGEGWQYSSGFVSAEIIQKALFPPSGDNLVSIQQTLHQSGTAPAWHFIDLEGESHLNFKNKVSISAGSDVRTTSNDKLCLHS